MLSVGEITPVPGEQVLIETLDQGLSQFYREGLPHHTYTHARDDILPEVVRLDGLQPNSSQQGRFNLIAATLGHDAGWHLPSDPEAAESKEERSVRLIRPVLEECGFKLLDLNEIDDLVRATAAGTLCMTPNQKKLRRGDIANVAGKRLPFLATTVNLFYEAKILADEYGNESPEWQTYVAAQDIILRSFLSQDLSLGSEPTIRGVGRFNREALRNVNRLSSGTVRNPFRFVGRYHNILKPFVAEGALDVIDC